MGAAFSRALLEALAGSSRMRTASNQNALAAPAQIPIHSRITRAEHIRPGFIPKLEVDVSCNITQQHNNVDMLVCDSDRRSA